jgi:hypothetical protein
MVIILRVLIFLLFVLAIVWPLQAYRRWPSPWRYGALLALVFPVVFVSRIAVHLLGEPRIYSLSDVELLITVFGSLGVMVLTLWLWRRRSGRHRLE